MSLIEALREKSLGRRLVEWIRRESVRILRFSAVGVPTTLLNVYVANELFERHDAHYLLAVCAGFACQVIPESIINRWWTFKDTGIPYWRLLLITIVVESVCCGITSVVEYVGYKLWRLDFLLVRLSPMLLTGTVSFTATKYWVDRISKRHR